MINDPYAVLGLTPDATDEEVKKAYRTLAKKYHPDMNPGDAHAAEMMNRINAAYDQIKNPPAAQTAYKDYSDPFAGWYQQQSQQNTGDPVEQARRWILMRDYYSALRSLNVVPPERRTAQWYYLAAICNTNLGSRVLGYEQIQKACEMDPGNEEYLRMKQEIEQNGTAYHTARQTQNFGNMDFSRTCCSMCAAYGFMSLFCRGGCPMVLCC
ncbi:MAG: DnaJ domain-containing protein [Clostridia bacterium]|nr:DnaJ domain-containing protein [Clostridia bacterium]